MEDETRNPFQSPQNGTPKRATASLSRVQLGALSALVLACALASGVAYYRVNQTAEDWFGFTVFWAAPVLAMLAVTGISLGWSTGALGADILRGARTIVLTVLIFVAGYIAFAATCCCTNMMVGGFAVYPQLEGNHWRNGLYSPSVRGGIVTAGATILAAAVIFALHRLRARRPS